MPLIDLNADLGESFGSWVMGNDSTLMSFINSCNIACGQHAGDPVVMRDTVLLATTRGIQIGAHPGLPDLQGFGRREMAFKPEEVYALMLYQMGALEAICRACHATLHHVKPHGALYHMAARDILLAEAVARAVHDFDKRLILIGLAGSMLVDAGSHFGLTVWKEAFADRRYDDNGHLLPRHTSGALIENIEEAVGQALAIAKGQPIQTANGTPLQIRADTLCVHGDGPHALALAARLAAALR